MAYIPAQIIGAVLGVWLAHLMFDEPVLQISLKARAGFGQLVSEFVATFGLIATILGVARHRADTVPWAVGLYITAAYWFTASTSFANPAVTIARALTNSFSGIAPAMCCPSSPRRPWARRRRRDCSAGFTQSQRPGYSPFNMEASLLRAQAV